jgi:hypothetical protein
MLATIYFVRGQKYALFEVPTYPESMEETRGKEEEEEEVEKSSARVVWGEVVGGWWLSFVSSFRFVSRFAYCFCGTLVECQLQRPRDGFLIQGSNKSETDF